MNEQFRIAHKLGLKMFFHDTPLPEDVKAWAINQLQSKSPALGIKRWKFNAKGKEWPKSVQPDLLEERDNMFKPIKKIEKGKRWA